MKAIATIAVLAALTIPAVSIDANASTATRSARTDVGTAKAAAVMARARAVADWQLANIEDVTGLSFPHETSDKRGWIQATFYIALDRLADATGDPRYAEAIERVGNYNRWMPGDRPFHADDHAIVQAYGGAFARDPDFRKLAPSVTAFRAIMKAAPTNSLEFLDDDARRGGKDCQLRWCWSDALFMAPASWFVIAKATGDARFADYADKEYWATVDLLYNPAARLFARDSRFLGKTGEFGEPIYWGRGNGWVFAGLVNILRALPADHPSRPRYVGLFRDMAGALLARQRGDGFWATSLAAPLDKSTPETSSTAFFVFGLAYGVNAGLLERRPFRRSIEKGWQALETVTTKDGRVGRVQQIGSGPDSVKPDDRQFYGAGGVILAAIEVARAAGSGLVFGRQP